MKKLLLLATGGTIASKKMENGLSPQLSSEEILSYLPEEARFANIETRQILNIDSTNIQPEDWTFIAACMTK